MTTPCGREREVEGAVVVWAFKAPTGTNWTGINMKPFSHMYSEYVAIPRAVFDRLALPTDARGVVERRYAPDLVPTCDCGHGFRLHTDGVGPCHHQGGYHGLTECMCPGFVERKSTPPPPSPRLVNPMVGRGRRCDAACLKSCRKWTTHPLLALGSFATTRTATGSESSSMLTSEDPA